VLNVRNAIAAGDELAAAGATVFIPHLTHFWHLIRPHSWQFWIDQDREWLRTCHAVVRLPGPSTGADLETMEAESLGIPVFCSVAECLRWLKEQ
jgi:hypothetical protein